MKKSGIEPNTRTYTTLINAYAGAHYAQDLSRFQSGPEIARPSATLPEPRTIQRITTIYNQSQTHITECVESLGHKSKDTDEDVGLAGDQPLMEEDNVMEGSGGAQEISLGPTNAYLKFLATYSRWNEMERIHVAMDAEGPLAPDNITYSILFSALLTRWRLQERESTHRVTANSQVPTRSGTPGTIEIGPTARSMWEHAVRQFHSATSGESLNGARRIDSELALLAMQCLLAGRPVDQRLATTLIPFLWDLPAPGVAVVASSTLRTGQGASRSNVNDIPPPMRSIPVLSLDSRAAKSILSMLSRYNQGTVAAYYADHILATRALLKIVDWGVLQSCIHILSNTGKVERIIDIFDSFQPPTGTDGWPRHVWNNALTAARWSFKLPAALNIFRRMTHLPTGFEDGRPTEYKWRPPNHKPTDIQGRRWIEPLPLPPDSKSMSLFLKTVMNVNNLHHSRQAWTIFGHYPLESFFVISKAELKDRNHTRAVSLLPPFNDEPLVSLSLVRAAEWRIILARDVEALAERMLEGIMSGDEARRINQVRKTMGEMAKVWASRLGTTEKGTRVVEEVDEESSRTRAAG